MKIISWNLKNTGAKKLLKPFHPGYSSLGLGGNSLDFITRFVTAGPEWTHLHKTPRPVDVFVIIELVSGGHAQGSAASGTSLIVLPMLAASMNAVAKARGIDDEFLYHYVPPVVTGKHETVGFIYNRHELDFQNITVPDNLQTGNELEPRGPCLAQFEFVASRGTFLYVAGIHAPPPTGAKTLKYMEPIEYSLQLVHTGIADNPNTFIAGDFNCNPTSWYLGDTGPVFPFTTLAGFETRLNKVHSSVRKTMDSSYPPPLKYLSDAYDNILFSVDRSANKQYVPDLIGGTLNMNKMGKPNAFATNPKKVFNGYRKTSDHLPVIIEF
jgi:endonuclease/exonuclease/phosphatase family metal-dependent hydrolase